jgi:hypothetical protein
MSRDGFYPRYVRNTSFTVGYTTMMHGSIAERQIMLSARTAHMLLAISKVIIMKSILLFTIPVLFCFSEDSSTDKQASQPPEIISAFATYEKAVVAARRGYNKAEELANNDAVKALEKAQESYVKKGDLDGALQVKESIKKLKDGDILVKIEGNINKAGTVRADSSGANNAAASGNAAIRFDSTASVDVMREGVVLFSNRNYISKGVSPKLSGLIFNKNPGGGGNGVRVQSIKPGIVYLAVCQSGADIKAIEKGGWKQELEIGFEHTGSGGTMIVFSRYLNGGLTVPYFGGFAGSVILGAKE